MDAEDDKDARVLAACAICYLSARHVYPAYAFDRRRFMDVVVPCSRFRELDAYVASELGHALRGQAPPWRLRRICVVLMEDATGVVVEYLDIAFAPSAAWTLPSDDGDNEGAGAGAGATPDLFTRDFTRTCLAKLTELRLPRFPFPLRFSLAFEVVKGTGQPSESQEGVGDDDHDHDADADGATSERERDADRVGASGRWISAHATTPVCLPPHARKSVYPIATLGRWNVTACVVMNVTTTVFDAQYDGTRSNKRQKIA